MKCFLFLLAIIAFVANAQETVRSADDSLVDEQTVVNLDEEATKVRVNIDGSDILSAVRNLLPGATDLISDTITRYEETLTLCDLFTMLPDELPASYDEFEAKIDACLDGDELLTAAQRTFLQGLFATDQVATNLAVAFQTLKDNSAVLDRLQNMYLNATIRYESVRDAAIARLKLVITKRISLAKQVATLLLDDLEDAENLLVFVKARLVRLDELSSRLLIVLSRAEYRYLSLVRDFYAAIKDFVTENPLVVIPTTEQIEALAAPIIKKFIVADVLVSRLRNVAKRVISHVQEERTTLLERVKNFVEAKIDAFVSTDAFKERIADKVRSFLSAHAEVSDEADANGKKRLRVIAKAAANGDKELLKRIVVASVKVETRAEVVTVEETQVSKRQGDFGVIASYGNAAANTDNNSASLMGVSLVIVCAMVLGFVF